MRNRILELQQEMSVRSQARSLSRRSYSARSLASSPNYTRMYQGSTGTVAQTDEQYLFNALTFFYPEGNLQQSEMNDSLRQLSAQMIYDAISASRQMDRVPRPTGRPTVTWALKQVVRALFVNSRSTNVYQSVRVTVARNRRSEFELARMGVGMSWNTAPVRAFNAIDYQVPGTVPAMQQPNGMACWATVTTILYGWRNNNQNPDIGTVLSGIGQQYRTMFDNGQGLPGSLKQQFINDAGFEAEPPHNPSIEGWEQMLRSFGPLWVTTDEDPTEKFAIHARVLIGMRGDGTPDGTHMRFIDPASGRIVSETISQFIEKYESEARTKNRPLRIQIVHWRADARTNLSSGSSYNTYSRARQDHGVIEMEPMEVTVSSQRREQILHRAGWRQANLTLVIRDFKGEPMLGRRIFAEAQATDVEPQTYAEDVRGGSAIFNNIWLKPSGTLRLMAVSTSGARELPSGVIHYTLPANNQLRIEATQTYRDIEVTATNSQEAAVKAGATGSIGVEFQIFSAGGEITSEETNTQGASVSRRYTVRVPTSTLDIRVL